MELIMPKGNRSFQSLSYLDFVSYAIILSVGRWVIVILVLSSSILQSLLANSAKDRSEFEMSSSGKVWVVVRTPLVSRVPVDVAVAVVPFGNSTEKGVTMLESVNNVVF